MQSETERLASPAAVPSVQIVDQDTRNARLENFGLATDIPSESFGSLQYNLSEEQLALIQENAQQYMQEHVGSPWELPVLQPAAESSKATRTGRLLLSLP